MLVMHLRQLPRPVADIEAFEDVRRQVELRDTHLIRVDMKDVDAVKGFGDEALLERVILCSAQIAFVEVDDAARNAGGIERGDERAHRLAHAMLRARIAEDVHAGQTEKSRFASASRVEGAEYGTAAEVNAGDLHRERTVVCVDAQFPRDEIPVGNESQNRRPVRG